MLPVLFALQGNETANGGANNHLCADNIKIPAASSNTYVCSPKAYGRYLKVRALFFPPVYFVGMHDACVCIFRNFFFAFSVNR